MTSLFLDWRHWTYEQWNERLIEYCFSREVRAGSVVERIPATPEELVQITGDESATPQEVVVAFVSRVKGQLPTNLVSFCGFCQNYGEWSIGSIEVPHFFGMLWLTCLVSYGYPDTLGGVNDRIERLFGRRQPLRCLPKLWSDLASWTVLCAKNPKSSIGRVLSLPPEDEFRSNIGHSWFLAFPHQNDRRKLRDLLRAGDLIGEEPAITSVVDILNRNSHVFSEGFRKDLDNFITKFVSSGADARDSAFWRAVRQEAIRADEQTEEHNDLGELGLLAYFDDDELIVYLACSDNAPLPAGYSKRRLGFDIDGMSNYVVLDTDNNVAADVIEDVTAAVLAGTLSIPRASRHIRRGVLVFKEELGGEYKLVGGAEANEASDALVRDDLVEAFVQAYGGHSRLSRFSGWREVVDCEIVVRRELPAGLESVIHLQETMMPPVPQLTGGIRSGRGFDVQLGFMPRVRFKGAQKIEVLDAKGTHVCNLIRLESSDSEWGFPNDLRLLKPGAYKVVVSWEGDFGSKRITETELVLVEGQFRFNYKNLGAGGYYIESCTPGEVEITAGETIPLGIENGDLTKPSMDLIDLEPNIRYLGPGCGEISPVPRPGFDWLVTGPKNQPDLLLFIGDPDSPTAPAARKSEKKSERRFWRKALSGSRRIAARLKNGSIDTLSELPQVQRIFSEYKRHNPGDHAPVFHNEIEWNETTRWRGDNPDRKVALFEEAIAALAVRRSGVRFKILYDLLAKLSEKNSRGHTNFIYDIARGWAESGVFDIAYAQGQRATYMVARRPCLLAFRVANFVRASLIGLVPPILRRHVERTAEKFGAVCADVHPSCRWLPKILRVECDEPELLIRLSDEVGLERPRWLAWPFSSEFDLRPDDQGLFSSLPEGFFSIVKMWDWFQGQFVYGDKETAITFRESGVSVEMRAHKERNLVYTVSLEGQIMAWSHIRNWALLYGYALKDGHSPISIHSGSQLVRPGHMNLHLPLPVGRLCAVLGDGPSGPVIGRDGVTVEKYIYPLGHTYLDKLINVLPVRNDQPPTAA